MTATITRINLFIIATRPHRPVTVIRSVGQRSQAGIKFESPGSRDSFFPERPGKVRGNEGQTRGEIRGKVEIREGASHGQTTTTSPPRDVTTIHQKITKTMASNTHLGLKSLHLISMMSPDEPQK